MNAFLDEAVRFFLTYQLPSGLYLDRKGESPVPSSIASAQGTNAVGLIGVDSINGTLASTSAAGFGLITLCIGAERGVLHFEALLRRASLTVDAVSRVQSSSNGFMLHWTDENGQGEGEYSTIDTSLFMLGALFAANYATMRAPAEYASDANSLAMRIHAMNTRIGWRDALLDSNDGSPGMWLTVRADGQGVGVTRIFNEYYLLAYCGAVAEGA